MTAINVPLVTRKFYFSEDLGKDSKSSSWPSSEKRVEVQDLDASNLVSSEVGDGLHAPVLDIDFPCRLVPSETEGHFHLYLDKVLSWSEYRSLLRALADAGIIERGFADASIDRGASFVATKPWKYKEKIEAEKVQAEFDEYRNRVADKLGLEAR